MLTETESSASIEFSDENLSENKKIKKDEN